MSNIFSFDKLKDAPEKDSDAQEFFAGGEKSGVMMTANNTSDSPGKLVQDILEIAKYSF
jgi:hypothetical protein